jgi:hypothetical protein
VRRALLLVGLAGVLAGCRDGPDLYSGPEAHTQAEVLALFEEAGLSCGHDPDPMGDDPEDVLVGGQLAAPPRHVDDGDECAPLGVGVQISTFDDEAAQRAHLDTTDHCSDEFPEAYDPEEWVVVLGRGWVLDVNVLFGLTDAEPIAEALGGHAYDLCA